MYNNNNNNIFRTSKINQHYLTKLINITIEIDFEDYYVRLAKNQAVFCPTLIWHNSSTPGYAILVIYSDEKKMVMSISGN